MGTDHFEYIYRGDRVSVACMPGDAKPSLIVSAEALADLLPVWRAASARAAALHPDLIASAFADLCSSLERMLEVYERESIDWWAKQPPPPEFLEAMKELEAARRLLEGCDFDPDDGPRRA
jgi:hypothetical protein